LNRGRDDVVVMGAGLAGLAAGHALSLAGRGVRVLEKAPSVGGLARTFAHGPFRFDLGGHRFFTRDGTIDRLVRDLLGPECLTVARRSQIFLRGRRIAYPLGPYDALSGLGLPTTLRIVLDGAVEWVRRRLAPREAVSLEDWVVGRFGRTLFDVYFEEYSEKVWGIGCDRISADWVAQRIQGLSLGAAVRNAFFPRRERIPRTLADRFLYPAEGIGRIAERLREEITRENEIRCGVEVTRIHHRADRVEAVAVRDGSQTSTVEGGAFVSTVPLPDLVRMLDPRPPGEVLAAAARLGFRDLVVVAVMLDRERATDQSWMYFPERRVPFGRIHEPTNWSERMAPPGTTLLVAEQFCFRGDATWNASDRELADRTVHALHGLGLASPREVLGSAVVRVPRAYPLFEVGYREHLHTVAAHLRRFRNLFPAGRGGTFAYHNMDHALASGREAAARILALEPEALGRPRPEAFPARRSA
jgi:protoporphyrinogen oxidase